MTYPGNHRCTRALVALALVTWFAPAAGAEDGEPAPLKLKVGNGPSSAVKLVPFAEDAKAETAIGVPQQPTPQTNQLRMAPDRRLDTEAAAETAAPLADRAAAADAQSEPGSDVRRLPAESLSGQSDFQPRFRTPMVRQAQHLEAVQEEDAADAQWQAEGSRTGRRPASRVTARQQQSANDISASTPTAPTAEGKALIEEAYAKSKQASTDADYSEIIALCGRASDAGLKTVHKQYAKQLMSWAYNRRGEARVVQGRDKEALADFEAAAELNPDSWRAVHNRGVSYAAEGRTTEAIADFDRTIKLHPKYANAHFNRGELLYTQGKFEEAIRDYKTAIDLGPIDAAMLNSLGHAYYRTGSFGDAVREYNRALELDPGYAVALVNRGDAYKDVSRYDRAAADYRAAIDAAPNMGRAYQAAAWLMATCPDQHYRNDKLALEAAQKAIELDGENHRNLETLAAAQANNGMYDEAKETQEKAIAKVPRDELVEAEKRMALYQRDLAFREMSQQEMIIAEQDRRDAEAEKRGKYAVRQASAEEPAGPQNQVVYPETQPRYRQRPMPPQNRSFWSKLNPFDHGGQPPRQQPRNLPRRPTRPRPQQNVRPW